MQEESGDADDDPSHVLAGSVDMEVVGVVSTFVSHHCFHHRCHHFCCS
jgi:hypothetical protein